MSELAKEYFEKYLDSKIKNLTKNDFNDGLETLARMVNRGLYDLKNN